MHLVLVLIIVVLAAAYFHDQIIGSVRLPPSRKAYAKLTRSIWPR